MGWPARLPLPTGNSSNAAVPRRKEGGSDDLSICELDADWATEVPEHGLSPALTRHFEQRGAFLYPVRFEGID